MKGLLPLPVNDLLGLWLPKGLGAENGLDPDRGTADGLKPPTGFGAIHGLVLEIV
jgi:hypothetical protein